MQYNPSVPNFKQILITAIAQEIYNWRNLQNYFTKEGIP